MTVPQVEMARELSGALRTLGFQIGTVDVLRALGNAGVCLDSDPEREIEQVTVKMMRGAL